MKRNLFLSIILSFAVISIACEESSERRDRETVQAQQEQYRISQSVPRFDYSLERDVAIQLYSARNEKVSTWTVWRSDYGMIEGDCPSVGYPLPYDTSLTNPLQPAWRTSCGGPAIEQAEPNGLFSSKNSIATWVRCVVTVNKRRVEAPVYIESRVTAYPFPVEVDYENNRVVPVGNKMPSVTISAKRAE